MEKEYFEMPGDPEPAPYEKSLCMDCKKPIQKVKTSDREYWEHTTCKPRHAAVPMKVGHQGKYVLEYFEEDKESVIVNRHTGIPIPDPEPYFILRAKDIHSLEAIREYYKICRRAGCTDKHLEEIAGMMHNFQQFHIQFPERVKTPD